MLEPGDFEERTKWADAHKCRTPTEWLTSPHATIDNKSFHMVTYRKGREFAARRSGRGAYQRKGSLPKKWLVKPKCEANKAKFPGVQVTAAAVKGKIRMWHYVEG